ncbi:MAG: hypothetical protein ABS44_21700 [Chryseobacterium sp. SCN 40-13]|nr:MAG: hypothetical protein ABS44_21700 [Chryseobacterium sp. SCN 40-13]
MTDFKTFFKAILNAVKVEAAEEFDRNFERKAFFDRKWPGVKRPNKKGSLMMRSGGLRRGQRSTIQGDTIRFTNSKPHANIHNNGGQLTVTAAMKKFFWAMYYKNANQVVYSVKTRQAKSTKRNANLNNEAAWWKSLALMKVGSKVNIPQRQWIGPHPKINEIVKKHVDAQVAELEKELFNALKQRK